MLRLKRSTRLPTTVSVVGCEFAHRGERAFRFLFNELFVMPVILCAQTDSPLIFDCGSNIGLSILFFKKLYPKARVIGFEPHPLTFQTLRENIERNSLSHVTLHCYALSDRDGTTTSIGR